MAKDEKVTPELTKEEKGIALLIGFPFFMYGLHCKSNNEKVTVEGFKNWVKGLPTKEEADLLWNKFMTSSPKEFLNTSKYA